MLKIFSDTFKEASKIIITLFKIMIPVIIVVKILQETGGVEFLSTILSPVMHIMGLPGETGLVWASALLLNLYAGIIVLISLLDVIDITAAQATVLGTVMLIAHNYPIEMKITKKAGTRYRVMFLIRTIGAILAGTLLNYIYKSLNILQENVVIAWKPEIKDSSLFSWASGQAENLMWIAIIITTLVFTLKILDITGITKLFTKALMPIFRFLGISDKAIKLIMVGFTLGLAYGGGLIIQEAESGTLEDKEVFFSLSLLALDHSVIEDTLLVMMIGGALSGVFWGRLIFTLIAVKLVILFINKMPDSFFYKHIFKPKLAVEKA